MATMNEVLESHQIKHNISAKNHSFSQADIISYIFIERMKIKIEVTFV